MSAMQGRRSVRIRSDTGATEDAAARRPARPAAQRFIVKGVLRPVAVLLVAVATLAGASPATADLADEQALANKHAPVVRLVEQAEECGSASRTSRWTSTRSSTSRPSRCAGRGTDSTWSRSGPSADDLADLFEYHLDFPGDALTRVAPTSAGRGERRPDDAPTVYAHVATEAGRPGQLALQYWFFYAYNDWNNLHEGDWEMVQLLFDAARAREALARRRSQSGTASTRARERGEWGDDKLELVDGTRPVVYPRPGRTRTSSTRRSTSAARPSREWAATTPADHTSSSAECRDDSERPGGRAASALPWIAFEGAGVSFRTRSSTGRPGRT